MVIEVAEQVLLLEQYYRSYSVGKTLLLGVSAQYKLPK